MTEHQPKSNFSHQREKRGSFNDPNVISITAVHQWAAIQRATLQADPSADVEFYHSYQFYEQYEERKLSGNDPDILVIDKPPYVPSYYSSVAPYGVLEIVRAINDTNSFAIVHAPAIDTTGVMVLAKTEEALQQLREDFEQKEKSGVKVYYFTIMEGAWQTQGVPDPSQNAEEIELRVIKRKRKIHVLSSEDLQYEDDEKIINRFLTVDIKENKDNKARTLMQIQTLTEKGNQINVTAAFKGYPVIGDRIYGSGKSPESRRMMLHAAQLDLLHPITKKPLHFQSNIPSDFQKLWESYSPPRRS